MEYNIPKEFKDPKFRRKVYKDLLDIMVLNQAKSEFDIRATAYICFRLEDIKQVLIIFNKNGVSSNGHADTINSFRIPLHILLPELERPTRLFDLPCGAWFNNYDYQSRIDLLNKAINKLTTNKTILSWVVQAVKSLFSRR